MLKTSRDRKYLVFGSIILFILVGVLYPPLLFGFAIGLMSAGAIGLAAFLYDWIITADEQLEVARMEQNIAHGRVVVTEYHEYHERMRDDPNRPDGSWNH
jgi:hypothetical protein